MAMIFIVFVAVLATGCALARPEGVLVQSPATLSDELVDYINKAGTTWKATQYERFSEMGESNLKKLMGSRRGHHNLPVMTFPDASKFTIPATFDSRKQWPKCPSIGDIRDEGACGSSWAVAAAEAMSDRLCIRRNLQVNISAENILSCCPDCGDGCKGGYSSAAWQYFTETGVVSGGQYNSNSGCQPYTIPGCDHHVVGHLKPCKHPLPTPHCSHKCRPGYGKNYTNDLHRSESTYTIPNARDMQLEIMIRGPIEVSFSIYADFVHYRTGVYHHVTGTYLGGHSVKIIGWGTEGGIDYWLVANAWNRDWGMGGYAKILRGSDECGIEDQAVAGRI